MTRANARFGDVLPATGVGRGRRAALLTAAALALGPAIALAAFRQTPVDPSPASGLAKVVAQGVIEVGPGDVLWEVRKGVAETPVNARPVEAGDGFLLADEGAILIEESGAGDQVRLASGEAAAVEDGDVHVRAALGPNATSYYEIRLLPAGEAAPAEGVFTGPAFAGPGARHDVDLVGATIAPGGTLTIPAGAAPSLVLVTAGSVEVATDAGEFIPLGPGGALSATGPLTLTSFDEGAVVDVAVIGPAVPRLTSEERAQPAAQPDAPAAATPVAAEPGSAEAAQPAAATPVASDAGAVAVGTGPATSDDLDGDGLDNDVEAELNTNASIGDTDGDGLTDGEEVLVHLTMPLADDTDGDGVPDGEEVRAGTDPTKAVGQEDGESAAEQPATETDSATEPATADEPPAPEALGPVDEAAAPADIAPIDEAPAADVIAEPVATGGIDSDGDGLLDEEEYALGSDPFIFDTDFDGIGDGDEYYGGITGYLNPDNDGDGVLDGDELNNGTDPNDPNSY